LFSIYFASGGVKPPRFYKGLLYLLLKDPLRFYLPLRIGTLRIRTLRIRRGWGAPLGGETFFLNPSSPIEVDLLPLRKKKKKIDMKEVLLSPILPSSKLPPSGESSEKGRFHVLISIVEKISPILDRVIFSQSPLLTSVGAYLFALCSTITSFFISSTYGTHLVGLLWFISVATSIDTLVHSLVELVPNFSADHLPEGE
jgi:hypothetical protein